MSIFKLILSALLFIEVIYYFYKTVKTETENGYGFECVKYQLWAILSMLCLLMLE